MEADVWSRSSSGGINCVPGSPGNKPVYTPDLVHCSMGRVMGPGACWPLLATHHQFHFPLLKTSLTENRSLNSIIFKAILNHLLATAKGQPFS